MKRAKRRPVSDTALGLEYARVASRNNKDLALTSLSAARTFAADELLVWSASLGKTRLPVGPRHEKVNPLALGERVLCSTFSPGSVVAFDRATGKRLWSLSLAYYGGVLVPGPTGSGLVYCGTSQELLAIDAATGHVAWSFCPYGRKGETIYSSPALAKGRLYVGDRRGYLHCLAAGTGEPVWRVRTSRAAVNDVNTDPVVSGNVVVVGTNAKLAAGYDVTCGRQIWRRRLSGPCTNLEPAGVDRVLLWSGETALLLSAGTGSLLGRWRRPNHAVDHGCVAAGRTLLVTRRVMGKILWRWPFAELRGYRGDAQVFAGQYPRSAMATMRYDAATRLVYEATSYGLGVIDPRTGERVAVVRFTRGKDDFLQIQQPSVTGGRIYALCGDGRVVAMRHP